MPQAASQSLPSRVEAPVPLVPFVKSIGLLWPWFHVATWFAEIVIVPGRFANALSVEGPSLRPPKASLWIEGSILASHDIE